MFLNEVKKGKWHPANILVSWDVCVYEIGQEVAVAPLFLFLKDPGHVQQVMVLCSNVSSIFPSR